MARKRDDLSVSVSSSAFGSTVVSLTRKQYAMYQLLDSVGSTGIPGDALRESLQLSVNSMRVLKTGLNHRLRSAGVQVMNMGHGVYRLHDITV